MLGAGCWVMSQALGGSSDDDPYGIVKTCYLDRNCVSSELNYRSLRVGGRVYIFSHTLLVHWI